MIPIHDAYGELVSFQGRALFNYEHSGAPKYYHAPFEKSTVLYGLWENASWMVEESYAVIVEGPLDVIALWDAGVPAIATMGTSFSQAQAYLFRRYTKKAVLWLDADVAGEKAREVIRRSLSPLGVVISEVSKYRVYKDASDAWQKAGHDGIKRELNG
jgi:DNA primase